MKLGENALQVGKLHSVAVGPEIFEDRISVNLYFWFHFIFTFYFYFTSYLGRGSGSCCTWTLGALCSCLGKLCRTQVFQPIPHLAVVVKLGQDEPTRGGQL